MIIRIITAMIRIKILVAIIIISISIIMSFLLEPVLVRLES